MESCSSNKIMRLEKAESGSDSKSCFRVRKPSEYNRAFPSFREPTEIGCFSLDGERQFHLNKHQMKYLVMPANASLKEFDLSKGYEKAVRKNQAANEKLDNILRWISTNKSKVSTAFGNGDASKNQSFPADFVCYRGLLTLLVCTLYENKEDWIIGATKFKGTIYLCEFRSEQRLERERNQTKRQALMSAWGYKFEQYMTADKKNGTPNTDIPVNENEEFCVTLKGRLGKNSLLFAAEVDCIEGPEIEGAGTKQYVELKTSRIITAERQDWNFCRFKLIKWWAQSFLIGIPKVICGFRDDNGIVQSIRTFRTKQMPQMGESLWCPSVAMNFCDEFLQFVKQVVVKDDPNIVYKFSWQPGQDVVCEELSPPGEFQILPQWYINSFTKQ